MARWKMVGLLFTAVVGFALGLVSALLVNVAPVNSGAAWAFAVSCIVGTWMGVGSLLLIINGISDGKRG